MTDNPTTAAGQQHGCDHVRCSRQAFTAMLRSKPRPRPALEPLLSRPRTGASYALCDRHAAWHPPRPSPPTSPAQPSARRWLRRSSRFNVCASCHRRSGPRPEQRVPDLWRPLQRDDTDDRCACIAAMTKEQHEHGPTSGAGPRSRQHGRWQLPMLADKPVERRDLRVRRCSTPSPSPPPETVTSHATVERVRSTRRP